MLIRTGVQKCEPFPTHITPFSPKWNRNLGKINLIGYRPLAGPNDVISIVHSTVRNYVGPEYQTGTVFSN